MKKNLVAAVLCAIALTVAIPMTHGETISGQFAGGISDQYGLSHYTVLYNYPKTVSTGSNLTVQLTLLVDNLTGQRDNVARYGYTVTLFSSSGPALREQYKYGGATFFYAGSHTPPVNVTFPINASSLSLSPGQTAVGNILVGVSVDVYYPYLMLTYPDIFQQSIGNVTISYPATTSRSASATGSSSTAGGQGPSVPGIVEIGGAVVVVLVVVVVGSYLLRRSHSRSPT